MSVIDMFLWGRLSKFALKRILLGFKKKCLFMYVSDEMGLSEVMSCSTQ